MFSCIIDHQWKRGAALVVLSLGVIPYYAGAYEIKHDRPAGRQAQEKLWHARDPVWQKYCLPIGNGKIGAMVYGGVTQERINFTLDSLWSGKVVPDQNIENTYAELGKVRELLLAGEYKAADRLAGQVIGCSEEADKNFGSFSTFGDLQFDTGIPFESVRNYQRKLDLDHALSVVEFEHQGQQYKRTAFVSHPDQCMVVRFEGSGDAKQNIKLSFNTPNKGWNPAVEKGDLVLSGKVADNGMPVNARIRVRHQAVP